MKLYSNEIVFRGHPDKVCDQISDAILDACLAEDKHSRCGIEVVGGKGVIFITGEITSTVVPCVQNIARMVLEDVGYPTEYEIIDNIGHQSPDIALGTNDDVGGAGDNGMMFGYATRETAQLLPKAQVILQEFSQRYDQLRKNSPEVFRPDGKAQITGYYDENMHLKSIKTATICYQNSERNRSISDRIIREEFERIATKYEVKVEQYLINPTGRFEIGGFEGDAGLTGRKIVVDSYHSFAPVGGGAFSGKDPTKVDRSGAYWARHIAKDILTRTPLIKWVLVQLSYAIGVSEPLAIYIETDAGVISVPPELYKQSTPANIIRNLRLKEIKYEELARFGHFKE